MSKHPSLDELTHIPGAQLKRDFPDIMPCGKNQWRSVASGKDLGIRYFVRLTPGTSWHRDAEANHIIAYQCPNGTIGQEEDPKPYLGQKAFQIFTDLDRKAKAQQRSTRYDMAPYADFFRTPAYTLAETGRKTWLEAWRCHNKIDWELIAVSQHGNGEISKEILSRDTDFRNALTRCHIFTEGHNRGLLSKDPATLAHNLGNVSYRVVAKVHGLDFAPDGSVMERKGGPDFAGFFTDRSDLRVASHSEFLRRKLAGSVPTGPEQDVLRQIVQEKEITEWTNVGGHMRLSEAIERDVMMTAFPLLTDAKLPLACPLSGIDHLLEACLYDRDVMAALLIKMHDEPVICSNYNPFLQAIEAGSGKVVSLLTDLIPDWKCRFGITRGRKLVTPKMVHKMAQQGQWADLHRLLLIDKTPTHGTARALARQVEETDTPYLRAACQHYDVSPRHQHGAKPCLG